jgi:Glycosyl transferases group 1
MASTPEKRLRILVLWGASHFGFLSDLFLENPKYDFEIVSGDRTSGPSPHAASWGRLLSLRRRLKRGEFDLVISGPIQNSAWPQPKRLATRLAQAFRYFTYKHRMLDSYWVPWLLSGEVRGKVPLAAIDFLDTSYVLPKDFPLLKAATLYFKLNLYFWPRRSLMPLETFFGMRRVTKLVTKLRPLTNGVAVSRIPATARPMRERDIDICFTGTITPMRSKDDVNPFGDLTQNPVRREIYERCVKLKGKYKVYCLDGMVPGAEYLELLQRSKLMVCTESFGCETFRHYEVAAAGAIPLVNWPYATNYMPFQPDVHAIYFSLIGDDFERTVARALSDPEKLEEIAKNTRAFTLEHKVRGHVGDVIIAETLQEHAKNRSLN